MPGSVPDGWRRVRLGEIAEVIGGSTPPRGDPECWNGSVPWVTPTEVTRLTGRTLGETRECITAVGVKRAGLKLLPTGTVLLTTRATIGAVARVVSPVTTNQGFQNLVPREGIDATWLYYVAQSSRPALERLAGGSTFKEVSPQSVRKLDLLLPPLSEQRAIAAVLDAVDDTIERTEAVIAATEELRRALLHELLTRGVPGMHSEWKHVPGLGTVPACWEVTTLGGCIERIEAGRSPLCETRPARDGEWGVLKVSSVSWGEFRPDENKALLQGVEPDTRFEIRAGDVILSRANTPDLVGRAVLVRTTPPRLLLSDKTLRLVPRPARISHEFLLLSLGTPASRAQISGAASGSSRSMFNVSQEALRDVQIALPPLDEQRRIGDLVEAHARRQTALQDALIEAKQLKSALSEALLTGRVRIDVGAGVRT